MSEHSTEPHEFWRRGTVIIFSSFESHPPPSPPHRSLFPAANAAALQFTPSYTLSHPIPPSHRPVIRPCSTMTNTTTITSRGFLYLFPAGRRAWGSILSRTVPGGSRRSPPRWAQWRCLTLTNWRMEECLPIRESTGGSNVLMVYLFPTFCWLLVVFVKAAVYIHGIKF